MSFWDAAKCFVICSLALLYWAAGQAGFVISVTGMSVALLGIAAAKNRRGALTTATAIWFTVVILCGLLLPAISWEREPARRVQCRNNLKQIWLALRDYHDSYGSFPPAYLEDESGKPTHSWRVLILPFLEERMLFEQYDFSEPWDGEHNWALADRMPETFRCPSNLTQAGNMTSYVAVVGSEAAWPGAQPADFAAIHDGSQNTILVVETANAGVHWMEPRDLPIHDAMAGINSSLAPAISSKHVQAAGILTREIGANVLFGDHNVRFLPENLDTTTLNAIVTRAGGESVASDTIETNTLVAARVVTLSIILVAIVVFVVSIHRLLRAV